MRHLALSGILTLLALGLASNPAMSQTITNLCCDAVRIFTETGTYVAAPTALLGGDPVTLTLTFSSPLPTGATCNVQGTYTGGVPAFTTITNYPLPKDKTTATVSFVLNPVSAFTNLTITVTYAGNATVCQAKVVPPLQYYTSWIGNTFPETTARVMGNTNSTLGMLEHTPQWIDAMAVQPDGTLYLNGYYDEGGNRFGILKDGKIMGRLSAAQGRRNGGNAIAVNSKYVFVTVEINNKNLSSKEQQETQNVFGNPVWPEEEPLSSGVRPITYWYGIARYHRSGTPAPFPGGWGRSGEIKRFSENVGGNNLLHLTGLALDDYQGTKRLYVSEPEQIRVYDYETLAPLEFAPGISTIPWAGCQTIVVEPVTHHLWVMDHYQSTPGAPRETCPNQQPVPRIHVFTPQGTEISLCGTALQSLVGYPSAICIDPQGRLLVADQTTQQILRFNITNPANPTLDTTFGTNGVLGISGGIYSPVGAGGTSTMGQFGDLRFNNVVAMGVDASNCLYISCNGLSAPSLNSFQTAHLGQVLECYLLPNSLLGPTRLWRAMNLPFLETGVLDVDTSNNPLSTSLYTLTQRLSLNLSVRGGDEWNYAATTIRPSLFPTDPRLELKKDLYTLRVLYILGKKYLFATGKDRLFYLYRFDSNSQGEIAIPGLHFFKTPSNAGATPPYLQYAPSGDFNAPDSTQSYAASGSDFRGYGTWVDSNGDIWSFKNAPVSAGGARIFRFPVLSNVLVGGVLPKYGLGTNQYQSATGPSDLPYLQLGQFFPTAPTPLTGTETLPYATGTLYLGGFTSAETYNYWVQTPNVTGVKVDRALGNVLRRYDNWATASSSTSSSPTLPNLPSPTWSLPLEPDYVAGSPCNPTDIPIGVAVTPTYLFIQYFANKMVYVYTNPAPVAYTQPQPQPQLVGILRPNFGDYRGFLSDVQGCIHAYPLSDGTYLILTQENTFGKNLVYRFKPGLFSNPDTPLVYAPPLPEKMRVVQYTPPSPSTPFPNQVEVRWQQPVTSDAIGYALERQVADKPGVFPGTGTNAWVSLPSLPAVVRPSPPTEIVYTDTTIVPNTLYHYRVRAFRLVGGNTPVFSDFLMTYREGPALHYPTPGGAVRTFDLNMPDTISIDFQGGTTSKPVTAMAFDETAGVIARANWNNAPGFSGSKSALIFNNSTASNVTVTWNALTTGTLGSQSPMTYLPGHHHMMQGSLLSVAPSASPPRRADNTRIKIAISGIPSSWTTFDVYIYYDGPRRDSTAGADSRQVGRYALYRYVAPPNNDEAFPASDLLALPIYAEDGKGGDARDITSDFAGYFRDASAFHVSYTYAGQNSTYTSQTFANYGLGNYIVFRNLSWSATGGQFRLHAIGARDNLPGTFELESDLYYNFFVSEQPMIADDTCSTAAISGIQLVRVQ